MFPAPLYDRLTGYAKKERARFFTPGHKGTLHPLDLTELDGTDNLFAPGEALTKAQQQAADYFGTHKTLFSAGGNTLCIQTMLKMAHKGGKMLVHRHLHASAVHGLALLGITPLWLYEHILSSDTVEKELHAHAVEAVYITSPDYYGQLQDITGLSAVCRKYNVPLLVDNAHGSHLVPFGLHPLTLGADATACSAHKTLPVLTGGAFLNVGEFFADESENLLSHMKLFASTSPNFTTLASLDMCIKWLYEEGDTLLLQTAEKVTALRETAGKAGISVLNGADIDPLRLTLCIDGNAAIAHFHRRGVEPEMCDSGHVVFLCSPFNTGRDFERLHEAIHTLAVSAPKPPPLVIPACEPVMTPREAMLAQNTEHVEISPSIVGRIAAESPFVCPPGRPLIAAGERITKEVIENAKYYSIFRIKVVK